MCPSSQQLDNAARFNDEDAMDALTNDVGERVERTQDRAYPRNANITKVEGGTIKRKRKRLKASTGEIRDELGFLPWKFKDLPLELKKSVRRGFRLERDKRSHEDQYRAEHPSKRSDQRQKFVLKETQGRYCKDGRLRTCVKPEALSTHSRLWDANVALLHLLSEKHKWRKENHNQCEKVTLLY
jgi:hypothetical protein